MVVDGKTNRQSKQQTLSKEGNDMSEKLETIRRVLADYMRSEGCSCCERTDDHKEAARLLAGLLDVPMYEDGSGYDFYRFASDEEFVARMAAV